MDWPEDAMSRALFFMIATIVVFRCGNNWRRLAAVTMLAIVGASIVFPTPASAQFGLLGGVQNIINIIDGAIRSGLSAIDTATAALRSVHEQIVWPLNLINRARSTIASMIGDFRNRLDLIYQFPTNSATLAKPAALESILRNEQINDFDTLARSHYEVFGALPVDTQADAATRNLIDIDDALALNTMKTLKASDRASSLILESGRQLENEARSAAPGSAPFLAAAGMAASIQSQAMMQKMLAATIRQEAARLAHENAVHKRHGLFLSRARQRISDMLIRR
jgi:hypothetical protein